MNDALHQFGKRPAKGGTIIIIGKSEKHTRPFYGTLSVQQRSEKSRTITHLYTHNTQVGCPTKWTNGPTK